jgi:hypothetical protein
MTKDQAVKRIAKLRTLARGTTNPNERDAAEKQARTLMDEHHLREDDLATPDKISSFDELVDVLGTYVIKHPDLKNTFGASKIVVDVLEQAKHNLSPEQKIKLLARLSQGLRIARLVVGDGNPTLNEIDQIFKEATKTPNP